MTRSPSDPATWLARERRRLAADLKAESRAAGRHLGWLCENMNRYFFITMKKDHAAVLRLAHFLGDLPRNREVVLLDREDTTVAARLNEPGSVHDTLAHYAERDISYAEMTRSSGPVPGLGRELEVYRFESRGKTAAEVREGAATTPVPAALARAVAAAARAAYPEFPTREVRRLLGLLWANDREYVRASPPVRVARTLWLLDRAHASGGLYLDVESAGEAAGGEESRLLFAVGNPPQVDFLAQVLEVLHRLDFGVGRCYCLTLHSGVHPYFLGSFYGRSRASRPLGRDSELFLAMRRELYNTQILATNTPTYATFVTRGVLDGEAASLVNAFIAFCHTTLAHNRPDGFGLEDIMRAFHSHPDVCLRLVELFRARFDPGLGDRERVYPALLSQVQAEVEAYDTGHKYIDDFRREVFRTCVGFIRHTLKTNFFVPEKHALGFRLDPAYVAELAPAFTADLPARRPFRITFFFGRRGVGYHVGYSDIARGGWRTVVARSRDDYVTNANPLFREVCVLAHTQHLKNKDIYEGGSKMVAILDASDAASREEETQRLHRLQHGFISAFFDLFVTADGRARDPNVVDYYGEDEPIELGPDENLHDEMVEYIAGLSEQRGYLLGRGVISSKRVGINHREFGVTSIGVVKFAEITMGELGVDIFHDPFSVKFTGGPNGDVAGNALRILLRDCPRVAVRLVVDGAGALCDPAGLDREELARLINRSDVDGFPPERLGPGGFLLFRNQRRREGMRELYRRVRRTEGGVEDQWVTIDAFNREFAELIYAVPADLFLPAGGRPETIDDASWERLFPGGAASCRAIVEGANSFLTPRARDEIQQRGVVVIRDASANKCGVISSSYEIIANLLMSDREFLAHKDAYVADVLRILEKRAEDEARLLFRRHREAGGDVSFTQLSERLSGEINDRYESLFRFFLERPELWEQRLYRDCLYRHLPRLLRETPRFRRRVRRLPPKYRAAILAAELAAGMTYHGGWQAGPEDEILRFLRGRGAGT